MPEFSPIKTATIAISETDSDEVNLGEPYEKLLVIMPTMSNTSTMKVGVVSGTLGTLYTTQKETPANVALPTGTALVVDIGGAQYVQIISGGAEAAARSVTLRGIR